MPLGAMVAREEVMDWPPGSHASTFGGNPVSCRAALATLDLLEGGLMANATERGKQLEQGLLKLKRQHARAGDVRGLGLMVAMDVVKEGDRSPDPHGRDKIIQHSFEQGLLLLGCGECAIRFCPPLCVSAAQVETALRILGSVLGARTPEKVAV
jgi:4-aminobutyrate aminotransferase